MQVWHIDLCDFNNLYRTNFGFRFVLVCIDAGSRYVFTELMRNKTGKSTATALAAILERSGVVPDSVYSDKVKQHIIFV